MTGSRPDHDLSVLNGLIETTIDSIDGYRRAATDATNSQFSAAFLERANEREQVVSRLREQVRNLGGTPDDEGSIVAAAHRAFLSLRELAAGSDDTAVIAEVDRGESYLKGKWDAALSDNRLSPGARSLVQQCYESVLSGHEQWRRTHEEISSTGSHS